MSKKKEKKQNRPIQGAAVSAIETSGEVVDVAPSSKLTSSPASVAVSDEVISSMSSGIGERKASGRGDIVLAPMRDLSFDEEGFQAKISNASRAARIFKRVDPEEDMLLSDPSFSKLAKLVEEYSSHLGTKTVRFNKSSNILEIDKRGGIHDRNKDVDDDKKVQRAYLTLGDELKTLMQKYDADDNSEKFQSAVNLYEGLKSLDPSRCNQENAITFAEDLRRYKTQISEFIDAPVVRGKYPGGGRGGR